MRIDHAAHGCLQLLRADPFRKAHDKWQVVLHRIGVGIVFGVNALLREAEAAGLCRRFLLFRGFCSRRHRPLRFSLQEAFQNLVFNALDAAFPDQFPRIELYVEPLVDLHRQPYAGDGAQAQLAEEVGDAELRRAHDFGNDLFQFLLQRVQRRSAAGTCSFCMYLWLRLRQGPLVDLAVLIQRNAVDLHGHSRHHVGRLALPDEIIQSGDIYFTVCDDISGDELFAGACILECLHGGIRDTGEFPDNSFHLRQFDAEAAHLDLSVSAPDKINISIRQKAHHITRAISTGKGRIVTEGISDIHFFCYIGPVQIAPPYTAPGNQQLAGNKRRKSVEVRVYYIALAVNVWCADRHTFIEPVNLCAGGHDRTLCRAVYIDQFCVDIRHRGYRHQCLPAGQQIPQRRNRCHGVKLPRHLSGHEAVRDTPAI